MSKMDDAQYQKTLSGSDMILTTSLSFVLKKKKTMVCLLCNSLHTTLAVYDSLCTQRLQFYVEQGEGLNMLK